MVARHPAGALILFVSIVGAAPHVGYSLYHGELVYYFGAWDEDHYGLLAINHPWFSPDYQHLLISETLLKALYSLVSSVDLTYVLADMVFPSLASLAALYCAAAFYKSPMKCLAAALFLVLATDVLSLSSLAVLPPPFNVAFWIGYLPDALQPFVVNNRITFLSIYRTPEPQTSWIILFLGLGAAMRQFIQFEFRGSSTIILLLVALVSPASYGPIAFSLLLVFIYFSLISLIVLKHRPSTALFATAAFLLAAGWMALQSMIPTNIPSPVFESRLPLLSVSTIGGAVCLLWIAQRWREVDYRDPWIWVAIFSLTYPPAVLNQQIVTGLMIMPQVWERTTTHIFLAIGVLAITKVLSSEFVPVRWQLSPRNAAAFLFLILAGGHFLGTAMRFPANEQSILQHRAYSAAVERLRTSSKGERPLVVLETPQDALFKSRVGLNVETALSYSDLVKAQNAARVFEWLNQRQITPEALRSEMSQAIEAKQAFPWLMLFFPSMDVWPLFSSSRATKFDRARDGVPDIVSAYQAFLAQRVPPARPCIIISGTMLDASAQGTDTGLELVYHEVHPIPLVGEVFSYVRRPRGDNKKSSR